MQHHLLRWRTSCLLGVALGLAPGVVRAEPALEDPAPDADVGPAAPSDPDASSAAPAETTPAPVAAPVPGEHEAPSRAAEPSPPEPAPPSERQRPSPGALRGPFSDPDSDVPDSLRALNFGGNALRLGGYIQPGFTYVTDTPFNQNDTDGFDFNNARLIGAGDIDIAYGLGAGFRFNFDVNRGNFVVRDVYGTIHFEKDLIALDVGQLKTPLGLALMQYEAKLQLPFSARTRQLAFGRDIGAQLRADIPIGGANLHIAGMLANGEGGFRQRRNLDDEFLYVGRVEIAPFGRMEWSEADLEQRDFQVTAGFSAGKNGSLTNELGLADAGASETRIAADLRAWFRGVSLRGELIRGFRDENEASEAFQRYGVAVQAGWVLPLPLDLPLFELVGRFQQIDLDMSRDGTEGAEYLLEHSELRQVQFGANVYLAKHAVKLLVMVERTDLLEGPRVDDQGDVLIGDAVHAFLHFGWL